MADDQRVDGYANALFEVARVEGSVDKVSDELFQFARALEGSDELRATLTDAAIPAERRLGVVQDLLGAKASPITTALVAFVVAADRARDLPAIIAQIVEKAASSKDRALATVRTAIELTDEQRDRLGVALGKATGKQIEVKVIVDPTVLGGIVAEIGDTVIDGTVRSRLEQLRAAVQ